MPGDECVEGPIVSTTHEISLSVSPSAIWPWLLQMGSGRAGWYSWDWIDNLGRKSAEHILPQYQSLQVGDIVPGYPGATRMFVVRQIRSASYLVLAVPGTERSDFATWALELSEGAPGETILRARLRLGAVAIGPVPLPSWLIAWPLRLGHHVMQTKQFRELRRRCES